MSALYISRRRQDRFTAWMPVFLLAALAAVAVWLDFKINFSVAERHKPAANSPESFIEKFVATRFDERGTLIQELKAERGSHFPALERMVVERPEFANRPVGSGPIDVRADKAIVYGKKTPERVEFSGKVRAQQPAFNGQPARLMETESLTAIPATGELSTQAAVKMTQADAVVETKGLKANTKTQQFFGTGPARIVLQPKPQ
jgi:LPS export ABC transporter protein LptC